jgi:hypothetical protein
MVCPLCITAAIMVSSSKGRGVDLVSGRRRRSLPSELVPIPPNPPPPHTPLPPQTHILQPTQANAPVIAAAASGAAAAKMAYDRRDAAAPGGRHLPHRAAGKHEPRVARIIVERAQLPPVTGTSFSEDEY